MILRNNYQNEKINFPSTKNEPTQPLFITSNFNRYPMMFDVYKKFSDFFNIPFNQFILGNGFENVMKNVLLGLKPNTMSWCVPCWNMLEVYCSALNIMPYKSYFTLNDKFIYESKCKKADVHYCTYQYNNLFKHKKIVLSNIHSKYIILDISYNSLYEIQEIIQKYKNNMKNLIIIGSFDKLYGCGLRFGFAIFDKSLNNNMQIQREQFINSATADFIINTNFYEPIYYFKNKIKKYLSQFKYISMSNNYFSFNYNNKILDNSINYSTFKIKTLNFIRIGYPENNNIYDKTINFIKKCTQ